MDRSIHIAPVSPAWLLTRELVAQLTPAERLILAYRANVWARPEQHIPRGPWRMLGIRSGRGWGKTHMIVPEITRRVQAGEANTIVLMAPTEDRAEAVQIQPLIEFAPPWFRPERYRGGIRWPNGVFARVCTAETARGSAGPSYDLAWCTELVGWNPSTRLKAWQTMAEATRKAPAQIVYDTTNSGRNDLISFLERDHTRDPVAHRVIHGTTFDNVLLPRSYLASVVAQYPSGSRRYREEILGESFGESAGALWQHEWIDSARRATMIPNPVLRVVALDPSQSDSADADEAGISMVSSDAAAHYYIEIDASERIGMGEQARRVVDLCVRHKASGVVIERNKVGDGPHDLIVLEAAKIGMRVERLARERPFPMWRAGTIYVREYSANESKAHRAEPIASLAEAGRLHHVGHFDALETEMVTWEPDTRKSPNRLDAAVYAVAELAALGRAAPPDAAGDIAQAATANKQLNERLTVVNRGRRI